MEDLESRLRRFRRVVIWGHLLGSHTHSYVHEGFARAFRALGAETVWTDDPRTLAGIDLTGTLFVSEGQVIEGIPWHDGCRYVLHNVTAAAWQVPVDRILSLQVHGVGVRNRSVAGPDVEKVNDYTFVERAPSGITTLYQPWATDLLPSEFDFGVPSGWPATPMARRWQRLRRRHPTAVWVGTIGGGEFGNADQVEPFRQACRRAGFAFVHRWSVDRTTHIRLVRQSVLAPGIAGRWQLENAYIPCRIFKNISYGRHGITNSPWVQSIFEEEITCRTDGEELFHAGVELLHTRRPIRGPMLEVQTRHTYLNRIATILEYLP